VRFTLIVSLASLMLATTPAFAHTGGLAKDGCHTDGKTGQRHCHPERLRAKDLGTCDLKDPPKAGDEGVFYGPLVRVIDGDTFEAKIQGVVTEFRLAEVDAPESIQPYGKEARQTLVGLVTGQSLILVPIDTDRYGRTVVFAWVANSCINEAMVRRGAGYFYDEYSNSDYLYGVENDARDHNRGVWALPVKDRVPPAQWRKEHR
jgi:endonuclease YncB( thermonuclease family)